MKESGFGSRFVLGLTGVTYRQLDYWARTRLVGASLRQAAGRGSRRVYSFEDLLALRVVSRMLDAGVSLQAVRRAVEYLQKHHSRPLTTLRLVAKGKRVFALAEDTSKAIEATAHGQVVISIAVEPIVRTLEADVAKLSAPRELDIRVRGRSHRVVITPDLQAGGYTAEVPSLPGCLTEGDTMAEAKQMVREAIALWIDASAATSRKRARAL